MEPYQLGEKGVNQKKRIGGNEKKRGTHPGEDTVGKGPG